MKYYSENDVKGLLEQMDSHFIKYLEDLPSIEIPKSNWHTGIPTEEGLYVIAYRFGYKIEHEVREMFYSPMYGMTFGIKKDIVAWQKIEPYKETE